MDRDTIQKILDIGPPHFQDVGDLKYCDVELQLIKPPIAPPVACSTLQGLVDLFENDLDEITPEEILFHITSPMAVEIISRESNDHGQRRVWARAQYPECVTFLFGQWHDPESFIIAAQQGFQRVKVEKDDGSFAKDLDYILGIGSKITAEHATDHEDDGFAQRVAVKQGVTLKAETILRPMIQLAPYRTFAEIDQVLSQFVFRARIGGDSVQLALFEGDGGRWKISAAAEIKAWLEKALGADVPIIS